MASSMSSALLRDLLTTTKDGDWGKDTPAEGHVPYRVIRGTDFPAVRHGDISSVPTRYLSESSVDRRTLAVDDILLETAGGSPGRPTGRSLLITQRLLASLDLPVTCASFARFLRVDRNKAEPRYVFWFLQHLYATGQMEEHQVQHTGVARFQYTRFAESQEITLPAPAEQRAIAHILGTLDDKIELNRRMNETLEAMARALFKSWFVDFDPVRDKAEGRDTGLPPHIADLFPDSFEDSELGEIPSGWEVRPLRDLAGYLSRGIGPDYVESGGVCVLNQKCIRDRRIDFSKARRHDQAKKPTDERLLRRLDVLVNSTGVGTLGRAAQVWHLPEPSIVDSHVTVLRAAPEVDPWFFGVGLTGREAEIEALGEGSTGQTELSRVRLGDLLCLAPPSEVQKQFGETASQLLGRLSSAQQDSTTVGSLRDTLRPKLLSGELRVQDPARILGGGD